MNYEAKMDIGPTVASLHSKRGTKPGMSTMGRQRNKLPIGMVFFPQTSPFKPVKGHQPNTTACPQTHTHTHTQSLTHSTHPRDAYSNPRVGMLLLSSLLPTP